MGQLTILLLDVKCQSVLPVAGSRIRTLFPASAVSRIWPAVVRMPPCASPLPSSWFLQGHHRFGGVIRTGLTGRGVLVATGQLRARLSRGEPGEARGRQLIGPVIIPVRANMSSRFSSPEVRPCPLSARARALASARRSRMSTSGGQYPNRSRVQGGGSGAVTEQAVPFGFQRDGFRE